MTKSKLAKYVAKESGLDYKTVMLVLNLSFNKILERLKFGENVRLDEFASFKIITRKKGKKFNFQTRESEEIPARYQVKVDLPKEFKEFIKNKTCYDGSEN